MKAYLYDMIMSILEGIRLKSERRDLLSNCTGRVLEIGSGTGINFSLYGEEDVYAIEPDGIMASEARKRIGSKSITLVEASAESIPFEDNYFDTVVVCLTLCTIPDPHKALAEIHRVCAPQGRLLVLEHIKNESPFLFRLQNILTPLWKKFAMGCHLNRDTLKTIEESSFECSSLKYFWGRNFISGIYINRK